MALMAAPLRRMADMCPPYPRNRCVLHALLLTLNFAYLQAIPYNFATEAASKNVSEGRPNPEDSVDRIEAIDVSSSQIIVTTSKVGPADSAKVSIEVVDLDTGERLPPMNLNGILLVITRGRYTVNFLHPNRWYGLVFRCEQQYGGPNGPVYKNIEEHLVKTHSEDDIATDNKDLVNITTSRYGNEGKSLENLVVTVRWEGPVEDRGGLDALANITLFCKDSVKYKTLRLSPHDKEKSVEVKLDNHFEIMEVYNKSRQIIASITPKNCPRICWAAFLYAEAHDYHFRREVLKDCQLLEPVTAKVSLRDYLDYEVHQDRLVVHTNYSDAEHEDEETDAYVQITAVELPETKRLNSSTNATSGIRYKVFSTGEGDDTYVLDHLAPERLYAVQYTYGKESPFAYAESRRFVVDTSARPRGPNGTAVGNPKHSLVRIHFESNKAGNASSTGNNTKGKHSTPKSQPAIFMQLDPQFKNYRVGVDIEPYCGRKNASHFWLSAEDPEHELEEMDLVSAICSEQAQHEFCPTKEEKDLQTISHDPQTGQRSPEKCSPNVCYIANVLVMDKVYSLERQCINVAKFYPILETAKRSQSHVSAVRPCLFVLSMLVMSLAH